MSLKYVDRVLETSITGGTGTLNLQGPSAGFRSFSVAGNGSKVGYVIDDGASWEIGIGTVGVGSPNTLSRAANPIASSNSNALVNFSTNVKNVRLAPIATLVMSRDESLNFTDLLGTVGGTANAHTVAMPVTSLGYTNGMVIMYRAPAVNTSASVTVNVDTLGAKALKLNIIDPGIGLLTVGILVVGVFNMANDCFDVISVRPKVDLSSDVSGVLPPGNGGAGLFLSALTARVISGLQTGNNTTDTVNDIDIAVGYAADGAGNIRQLATALTKQLDATFAAGTNQGGLFTGSKAPNTNYAIWLVRRTSDGLIDIGFDTSVTGANVPSGWTKVCRVGWVRTDATVAPNSIILPYSQIGDRFTLKSPPVVQNTNVGNARYLFTLPSPPSIEAIIRLMGINTSGSLAVVVQMTSETDLIPSQNAAPGISLISATSVSNANTVSLFTDSSSQIAVRGSASGNNISIATLGWIDRRGKED